MIQLAGILLVVVGFALRWNTLAVALGAALATGLLAGIPLPSLLELVGQFFLDNRQLTLPVIFMVPVVGLLERHGLQQHMGALIRRAGGANAGRVLGLYQALRGLTSMFGLQLGNHASMVRPIVAPMAEGAAGLPTGNPTHPLNTSIRAHAAAAENIGNFFADDIVVAVGALLLIRASLEAAGIRVDLADLQLWSLPTALWVFVVGAWRYARLNRQLRRSPPPSKTQPS